MPVTIMRLDDFHCELTPTNPLGPIPHTFTATPAASQRLVAVGGEPLLRRGDRFENEGATHSRPLAGTAFANAAGVTGKGRLTAAGQEVLYIDGRPAATLAGRLETCSDMLREVEARTSVILNDRPVVYVDRMPVLPGCNP